MTHIIPRETESCFEIEELFFSRTDLRGVISAGNNVFVRVSGYSRDEILDQPHNIVRHPDMPKAVFKLFWDMLHSGRAVTAYVKNMSKDGSYYWVLASAFPIEGGYLSVRMKPSSDLFRAAQGIYAEVLAHERTNGVESASHLLLERLKEAGFRDYPAFMHRALSTELELRDRAMAVSQKSQKSLASKSVTPEERSLMQSLSKCTSAAVGFKVIFNQILKSSRRSTDFRASAEHILHTYRNIQFLSINMTIESEHLGELGRALSVTSKTFAVWAEEIQHGILEVNNSLQSVTDTLETLEFSLSLARCQVEMTNFFIHEYLQSHGDGADHSESLPRLLENCSYFFDAPEKIFNDVEKHLQKLDDSMRIFVNVTERLNTALNALKLVRQNAKIEVARLRDGPRSFLTHLEEMQKFIEDISSSARSLNDSIQETQGDSAQVGERIRDVARDFKEAARVREFSKVRAV